MRIGIIAALPGELKPLVRGWQRMPVARGSGIRMWQTVRAGNEVIAACAGMGSEGARRAFAAAEFAGSLDAVLSVGWAGALTEGVRSGECYAPAEVIDAQTGERFALLGDKTGSMLRLVTTVSVTQKPEKLRLAASYGAVLVDMEAAIVARLAQIRAIPMRCLKGVSDDVGAELPDLNRFIDGSGKLEMARFLAWVAVRPRFWRALFRLGRNSSLAARRLAAGIEGYLDGQQGAGCTMKKGE